MESTIIDFPAARKKILENRHRNRVKRTAHKIASMPTKKQDAYLKVLEAVFAGQSE